VGSIDIRLYNSDLTVLSHFVRNTKENTIKFIIPFKNNQLIIATNNDIEIYKINDKQSLELVRCFVDIHRDTILCIDKISDHLFASSSSDGCLIIWDSRQTDKSYEILPFKELKQDKSSTSHRYVLNSIFCFRSLFNRFIVICSGNNLSIYDTANREFVCKVIKAHDSMITDIMIINNDVNDKYIITSSEDGAIRIWTFKETSNAVNKQPTDLSLILIGECLGHSASILKVRTITNREIISSAFDNMVIIWRKLINTDSNNLAYTCEIHSKLNL
jgi:WD40 repeat protein